VSLVSAAALLRVTALDVDGDSTTQTAEIGDRFSFVDDVPATTLTVDTGFKVPVLTTQDADTLTGADTATADFSGALVAANDFGNDGPADANSAALSYGLALQGNTAAVASGLSSEGAAVTLHLIGGQIVGSTEAAVGDVDGTNTVFTIDVDAAGQVILTQTQPIDHSDTADNNDLASLAAGLVVLTAGSSVTDGDGDTGTDTAETNIGDSFVFTDDGLVVAATPVVSVDETDLRPVGATLTARDNLNVGVGADR
jgi:hypothetical protein